MTQPSSRFFCNTACAYYPCHEGLAEINCLFCYCPLHSLPHCPGTPRFIQSGGKTIKDCSGCTYPHKPENYENVIACLMAR